MLLLNVIRNTFRDGFQIFRVSSAFDAHSGKCCHDSRKTNILLKYLQLQHTANVENNILLYELQANLSLSPALGVI